MIGKLFLWHDFLKNRELGELLGNPKGTKSFSSWSEFTDFVNEMPIKTIQPFVSNFNAFAGEGFYGNVVQGLVIKQLEDAVFIFGIAIDGTLIFRKRNYPDVSTWEDPKIIIHSNNWHKIYFVTDLGELLTSLKLYPFMYKGIVENRSYNDMIEAGFYKIQNNMIDGPNTYWGTLVVFNDSAHITQVFYPNIDSAEISTRKGSINNFAKSAWRSISFT